MVPIGPVILTDEENQECQSFVSSVISSPSGGEWYMKEELIEPFKRSLVAICMMGRAQRFAILNNKRMACEAAAKACGIYPLSINFYDFGCILKRFEMAEDAKTMFSEFLRRFENTPQNLIDQITLGQRDVEGAVVHARQEVSGWNS